MRFSPWAALDRSCSGRSRRRLLTQMRGLIMNLVQWVYPCLALSPIIKSWQYSCFQWEFSPGKFEVLSKHHLKILPNTLEAKCDESTGCLNVKALEGIVKRTDVLQWKEAGLRSRWSLILRLIPHSVAMPKWGSDFNFWILHFLSCGNESHKIICLVSIHY